MKANLKTMLAGQCTKKNITPKKVLPIENKHWICNCPEGYMLDRSIGKCIACGAWRDKAARQ